jgi:2-dehydro-3-deoxyphosphogluconate aldolase/(4S)-4-hydroxy-2-oxoglutarate aldolase
MTSDPLSLPPFKSRVLPVIVVTDPAQAVPLAHALLAGGIDAMEITLRHAAGLPAIAQIAQHVPQMHVGAGTVTQAADMARVQAAGATFALSPGMTEALLQAARDCQMPFIPGAMTPSEIMHARDCGYRCVKLFPAAQVGGVAMLKALAGPLGDMRFCPTGGIGLGNLPDYLRLANVAMVGGSWLTPPELIAQGDWAAITRLAAEATAVANSVTNSVTNSAIKAV